MSFQPLLMLKYSDVIGNGLASASAFFDDISEAGGEKSLDVLATINNRLIEAPSDPETHGYLEQEFLDAATRRAVTRSRFTHGMPSLVFTRAGAAINLKLLIAGAPYGNTFRRSAIGKIALHANDYAESANTDRLKSGLLPIVAEFTAAWTLNNAREIGPLLRRSYFIYDELFKRNEAMRELFQREMRTLPSDVEFAGLSFERYFQLIFATYAVAQASVRNWTSVVDISQIARTLRFASQDVRAFARRMVSMRGSSGRLVGTLSPREEFARRVNDLRWCFDLRQLRDQPLLRLGDGRILVSDLQLLIENASAGLSWHLMKALPSRVHETFLKLWGHLFEEYVQLLIAHYLPTTALGSLDYKHGQIDAVVRLPDDGVIVFEVKSGYLADTAKLGRDERAIASHLRRRYVRNDKNEGKGVTQLARAVSSIYEGTVPGITKPKYVYPVLVVEDPAMQSLAVNAILDKEYRELVGIDTAMPLTLVTIDELDIILRTIAADHLDWNDVLQAHMVNNNAAAISVSATLHDLVAARELPIPPDTFLKGTGQALTRMLDAVVARAA